MKIANAVVILENGQSLVFSNLESESFIDSLMDKLLPSDATATATVPPVSVPDTITPPAPRKRGRPRKDATSSVPKTEKGSVIPEGMTIQIPIGECYGIANYLTKNGVKPFAVWRMESDRYRLLFLSNDGQTAFGNYAVDKVHGGFLANTAKIIGNVVKF